jgi:hypothetical protein
VTRAVRQWVCRVLIGTMLFAQMAVAAYACPGLSSALEQARQGPAVAATMGLGMASADDRAMVPGDATAAPEAMDCEHMGAAIDKASPNLCAQHCQQGHQSDQASTVAVPLVVLTSLYTLASPSETALVPHSPTAQPGAFAAVSPPHSILHCCFRV